ncbi:MAG: hypothetical protein AB1630_02755 [bacterium]
MEDNKIKIVIGNKVFTKEELFKEKEKLRKLQANLPFEEKIRSLILLQKLAVSWGQKRDILIWKL